jgi:hypothetical protein
MAAPQERPPRSSRPLAATVAGASAVPSRPLRARAMTRALKAAKRLEAGALSSTAAPTAATRGPSSTKPSLRRTAARMKAFRAASLAPRAAAAAPGVAPPPPHRRPTPPPGPPELSGFTWADVRKVYPLAAATARSGGLSSTGSSNPRWRQRPSPQLLVQRSLLQHSRPHSAPSTARRPWSTSGEGARHSRGEGGGGGGGGGRAARPCSAVAVARRACHHPTVAAAAPPRPASATIRRQAGVQSTYVPRRSFRIPRSAAATDDARDDHGAHGGRWGRSSGGGRAAAAAVAPRPAGVSWARELAQLHPAGTAPPRVSSPAAPGGTNEPQPAAAAAAAAVGDDSKR